MRRWRGSIDRNVQPAGRAEDVEDDNGVVLLRGATGDGTLRRRAMLTFEGYFPSGETEPVALAGVVEGRSVSSS